MKCWVCNKPLPNRQTRWRKLKVFEESSSRFITGKREVNKIVHRKCREDFVMKHRILRAAGQPHMLPPEKKPIEPLIYAPAANPRTVGKSANFVIFDDIECSPQYDTKGLIDAFYTKVIKGGSLNGSIATTCTD
jgi:hypothetical protein